MFNVEAESLADVEAAVATWVVTPDTTLTSITGTVFSESVPLIIPDGGEVSSGTRVETPIVAPPEATVTEPEPEGKSK
jgi:hypothetical protein